jgi:hypothetical protein
MVGLFIYLSFVVIYYIIRYFLISIWCEKFEISQQQQQQQQQRKLNNKKIKIKTYHIESLF